MTHDNGTVIRSSGLVQHPFPDQFVTVEVMCEPGEVASGWGFSGDSDPRHFGSIRHAVPIPDTPGATPTGFTFVVRSGTQNLLFEAYVVCARPGSSSSPEPDGGDVESRGAPDPN
jgi:hypothetical protein